MKPLIKSLSVIAIGSVFAGAAVAGPGDAHSGYLAQQQANRRMAESESVGIALFRTPAVAPSFTPSAGEKKVHTAWIPSGNPKMPGVVPVTHVSE